MQWHGAEGKRLLKASPSGFLSRRIPFLPIGEVPGVCSDVAHHYKGRHQPS